MSLPSLFSFANLPGMKVIDVMVGQQPHPLAPNPQPLWIGKVSERPDGQWEALPPFAIVPTGIYTDQQAASESLFARWKAATS